MLASVEDGIRLRTAIADIDFAFAAVQEAVRVSDLKDKARYLDLLESAKSQRVFGRTRDDEVGGLLSSVVAPILLPKGQGVVTDRRRQDPVTFILATYSHRGEHGPVFCLPDGSEFLRHVVMIE